MKRETQMPFLPFDAIPPVKPVSLRVDDVRFDGSDYDSARDNERLTGQIKRIFDLMKDGNFRTLADIERVTRDPQASISAQLRHLKKARFGGHGLEKRHRGEPKFGLYEYRLIVNK